MSYDKLYTMQIHCTNEKWWAALICGGNLIGVTKDFDTKEAAEEEAKKIWKKYFIGRES